MYRKFVWTMGTQEAQAMLFLYLRGQLYTIDTQAAQSMFLILK